MSRDIMAWFSEKTYPGRILMRCASSGMPGSYWDALVAFVPKAGNVEVWNSPDVGESEPQLVREIPGAMDLRQLVSELAHDSEMALAGDFLIDASVSGVSGPWADLLLLAWMHDEDAYGLNHMALQLLSLDSGRLTRLHTAVGGFDGAFAARARELITLAEEAGVTGSLAELLDRASPEDGADLDALERAIPSWSEEWEKRQEAASVERERRLAPFHAAIDGALARLAARSPRAVSAFRPIRHFIEERILESGTTPAGVHDFGHVRTGYRSGVDVGRIDFDELFS